MSQDHYKTLGVAPTASASDVRRAYLRLAREYHPDTIAEANRASAEARMQAINEAWNVVGVAHKRKEYDRRRGQRTSGGSASGSGPAKGSSGPRRGHAHFQPFDDEPITRPDIDLDATPIAGSRGLPRWVTFLPILLVIGGVITLAFGTFVRATGITAAGVILLALGGVSFVMLPLLVMSRAERDPDL